MVPWNDAKISVFDRGFQYGDGVFEGMRCYDGRIFKLKEHTDRLFRSARAVHIDMPLTKEAFNEAVKRVLRENGFRDAHVKPQVTRGTAPKLGLDPRNTTTATIVIPARPIGKSMFDAEKGFRLAAVSVRKIPAMCLDPRVKSLNYLVNILARAEAQASGADEAIMMDIHGYVAEGAGDNLFLVRDGMLVTPSVQDALEGITRATVIELARRENIPVQETRLTLYDFYTADEIFATGSGAGVIAVTEIDKKVVSDGKMGRMTRRISGLYEEEVKKGEPVFADA
jgi:branched-chain amino acid aminotransferase